MVKYVSKYNEEQIKLYVKHIFKDERINRLMKQFARLFYQLGLLIIVITVIKHVLLDSKFSECYFPIIMAVLVMIVGYRLPAILEKPVYNTYCKKQDVFGEEITYVFATDYIRITKQLSDIRYQWTAVKQVGLFEHHLCIDFMDRRCMFLNLNQLSTDQINELTHLLLENSAIDDGLKTEILRCYHVNGMN